MPPKAEDMGVCHGLVGSQKVYCLETIRFVGLPNRKIFYANKNETALFGENIP